MPTPAERQLRPHFDRDAFREYCRTALRRLGWPGGGQGDSPAPRTLGLTSCSRREGVSTVAARLALTAAEADAGPILLVDANLANPAVHEAFDVDQSPGLAEAALNPAILPTCLQPSGFDNLELLTAGEPAGKLPGAFDIGAMGQLMEAIGREYALVVFDLPPAGQQSSALRLAGLLDAVVMVVEAERVHHDVARRAKQLLERAGARVCGAVLNKRRSYVPRWLRRTM